MSLNQTMWEVFEVLRANPEAKILIIDFGGSFDKARMLERMMHLYPELPSISDQIEVRSQESSEKLSMTREMLPTFEIEDASTRFLDEARPSKSQRREWRRLSGSTKGRRR